MLFQLILRIFVPQIVGLLTFGLLWFALKRPDQLVSQALAVVGTAVVAWIISRSIWGGTELVGAAFITGFVVLHVFGAVAVQVVIGAVRESQEVA